MFIWMLQEMTGISRETVREILVEGLKREERVPIWYLFC
jgi:hypothetical protein